MRDIGIWRIRYIGLEGIYEEIVKSKDFSRLKDIVQTALNYIQYPELGQEIIKL